MSRADRIFIDMCKNILENGGQYRRRKSPPTLGGWKQCLHHQEIRVVNRYDLSRNFRQLHLEGQPLRAVRTRCSGSGRRSLIISKI